MTIGEVILLVVSTFLVLAIAVVEWIKYERNRNLSDRQIKRKLFVNKRK